MSLAMWGVLLGLVAGLGLMLSVSRVIAIRRPPMTARVLPYIRDVPLLGRAGATTSNTASPLGAAQGVFGPSLRWAAGLTERVFGGSTSVRRRIERAGLDMTVHDFRIEQVLWGVAGFALAAGLGLLRMLSGSGSILGSVLLCGVALVFGTMARDTHLTSQATRRERQVVAEFPTVAELLALAVAAGESPVSALDRVVKRSGGELSKDLARVLADIRTGTPVAVAFDSLASRTGLSLVARFARGIAVALDRGTPLADVLHAQAADVREAGRRELIETAARKEVFMMAPVVFLVLPVTVLFAFFPGAIGLSMVVP